MGRHDRIKAHTPPSTSPSLRGVRQRRDSGHLLPSSISFRPYLPPRTNRNHSSKRCLHSAPPSHLATPPSRAEALRQSSNLVKHESSSRIPRPQRPGYCDGKYHESPILASTSHAVSPASSVTLVTLQQLRGTQEGHCSFVPTLQGQEIAISLAFTSSQGRFLADLQRKEVADDLFIPRSGSEA